jgi:hypothetical protein
MGESHRQPRQESASKARLKLSVIGALLLGGIFWGWNLGRIPADRTNPSSPAQQLAGDLALYQDVIAQVRGGRDYYEAARELLPRYGFPISSPLNWRLPTYAWLFSLAPSLPWVQVALVALSAIALAVAGLSQWRAGKSVLATFALVVMLIGVVSWAIDGKAYVAQEPWVATLILLSVSTFGMGRGWAYLSALSAVAALFLRELALPYCVIACLLTLMRQNWRLACVWGTGIAAFLGFFCWHVFRVHHQMAATDDPFQADLGQWIRFGGLDFVLLTMRMNQWLFTAPGWLLWCYLLAALIGLSSSHDHQLGCVAAVSYITVFAALGRPENFYWGLLTAPLLPWGVVRAPASIWQILREAVRPGR